MLKARFGALATVLTCVFLSCAPPAEKSVGSITVPVTLDHNRMMVEAEFRREDGSWLTTRLWIDTGAPDFYMSERLARDLGIDLPEEGGIPESGRLEIAPPSGVRIGGMPLNFEGVSSTVLYRPAWLFSTMPIEANLPATVLKQHHVIFDYPQRRLTLAGPGSVEPRGERVSSAVNGETGIVQIDAVIEGERFSFALDNGASYSFVSEDDLARMMEEQPDWPRMNGAVGCANIWGWWPEEAEWTVGRLPEIGWGSVRVSGVGLVGLPGFFEAGASLGEWYSKKAARPVVGFLGPNAFEAFRIEIDYANAAVYFEKGAEFNLHDMDLVGLTLRPEADGSYRVIGVARLDGKPAVPRVEPGDTLLRVDDLEATGASMGTVVDALRGRPGEVRTLVLDRGGERIEIEAPVERLL